MLPAIEEMMISEDRSLRDVLEAIEKNAQRIIFVVDGLRRLTGLLTDGDIRSALLRGKTLETRAGEISNKKYAVLPVDSPAEDIARLLGEKFRHIPLIDKDGTLVDYACLHRLRRIPVMDPYLNGNELNYVVDCIKTKWISSQGKYVLEFERIFSELNGGGHAVAVSNGTVALHLALLALGIGPGDEVIVPDLTFAASINTVIQTGATPVLVDILPGTWCIDPDAILRAITPKTRAIMPVHLYGHPCDMDRIMAIAAKHGLKVLEDAAEAFGATYKGQAVGTFGEAGCFSFFGNKMVTTGEGGMVFFKSQALADRARMLRDHGMSREKRYWHLEVGYNYRMTNLQAAVGVAQLEQFSEILDRKLKLAAAYSAALSNREGITLQAQGEDCRNVYWLYTILVSDACFGSRDDLIKKLLANGIETRPVFYPLHEMPPYQKYCNGQEFPVSTEVSRAGLSLPSSAGLTSDEIQLISRTLVEIFKVRQMIHPTVREYGLATGRNA